MRKIAVVINAHSGGGGVNKKVQEIVSAFESFSIKPEVFLFHKGIELKTRMEKILSQGFDTVVAAGGDGTVGNVGGYLANSTVKFGIIPVGTLNHLAKDLSLPLDTPSAVKVIAEGIVSEIDVGMVNGSIFLNNASVGIYPKMIRYRDEHIKSGRNRWLAVGWAIWNSLQEFSYLETKIEVEGKSHLICTPFIFVGNNEYEIEGFGTGARAALTDGKLCVYVSEETTKWQLVRLALRSLLGFLRIHQDFNAFYTEYVSVHMRKKFVKIALDGEVKVLPTPLHFSVLPKALKIFVPKN